MLSVGLETAIRDLKSDKLIIYPTETFYALGALPTSNFAVHALLSLKQRSATQGLPMIISSEKILEGICEESLYQRDLRIKFQNQFWPGPVSIVVNLKSKERKRFANGVTRKGSIMVRISSNVRASELVNSLGGCVISTSANLKGEKPTRKMSDLNAAFSELVVLEGNCGPPNEGASTILDLSPAKPKILRNGANLIQVQSFLESLGFV